MHNNFQRLDVIGFKVCKGNVIYEDLPKHVVQEFDEKTAAVNRVLQESGILEKLKNLGINLNYHITVFDSK